MKTFFIIFSVFLTNLSFADRIEMRQLGRSSTEPRLTILNWNDLITQVLSTAENEILRKCRESYNGTIEVTQPNRAGILQNALDRADLNPETGYEFSENHINGRTEISCRRVRIRDNLRRFECDTIIHRFCSYGRNIRRPRYNDRREILVKPSESNETDKNSAQD